MAMGVPPVDEELLPWIEPERDAAARVPPPEARSNRLGAGPVVGGIAAIAGALTAGYYIGQREQTRPPEPSVAAEAPVTTWAGPVAEIARPQAETVLPPANIAEPDSTDSGRAEPLAMAEPTEVTKGPLKRNRDAARQRALANLANERARLRAVRYAEEQAAAAAVAAATERPAGPDMRSWPKMPSPGPIGQVVQLGAFRTEGRALAVYRTRLSRYPLLSSMPQVVVPVITKPRGQVLYVLRLGTASRQQSRIVCRNLKASGDHCIVIG